MNNNAMIQLPSIKLEVQQNQILLSTRVKTDI